MKLLYIALIIIGLFLRYWVNRRRFNRRSIAGVQLFTSYEDAFFTRVIEFLIKFAELVIIVIGILGIFDGLPK